jgi:biopolymer transport protein ExbD
MAGSQNIGEASDNPVAINVTAMVDVIFCLCIFFMCSFHFKQLEGKIETWLPKDRGVFNTAPQKVVLEEIRVFMKWDPATGKTIRQVNNRATGSDQELMTTIMAMVADYKRLNKTDFPVLIDATADVPWQDVVHVMDMCKKENVERLEFAAPMEYQVKKG